MLKEIIQKAIFAARELPQVETMTNHYFANGMYAREVFMPAGQFAIGRAHKLEHFFMLTKGKIQVATEGGYEIFTAPSIVVSKPGDQRALFILEDAVCVAIHRTDKTNLDEIVEEVTEPCPLSMYDAHNTLIDPLLNEQKKALWLTT